MPSLDKLTNSSWVRDLEVGWAFAGWLVIGFLYAPLLPNPPLPHPKDC